jgi:MFS family permease
MQKLLRETWPLLGGLMLLMVGNGIQGTLLGLRGEAEGMSPFTISLVMSVYFVGFLAAARLVPKLIAAVGHVRVFAAIGIVLSAGFTIYGTVPDPLVWGLVRVCIGFAVCGLYVTVESWLNETSDNDLRGRALSAYVMVQLAGIVASQVLVNAAPVGEITLFALIAVLSAVAVLPLLLMPGPVPAFHETRPLGITEVYRISPLGFTASFLLGSVFASVFSMSAVYGSAQGLSVAEIAIFTGATYAIGFVVQYPLGALSDRIDRRLVVLLVCAAGAAGGVLGLFAGDRFWLILIAGALSGGLSVSLWSLIVAHTADQADRRQMPGVSGGLLFVNGLGAIGGPGALGWLMETTGPAAFFGFNGALMGLIALYALQRMLRRRAPRPGRAA